MAARPRSRGGRLNTLGYRIGQRVLELLTWRTESITRAPKREIRFLPALRSIHAQVWRAVFGKQADAIEKSVENDDECASSGAVSVPAYLYLANHRHGNTVLMLPALCLVFADMIIDNDPPITRYISVPRDMSQLSCSALTAGIVEAVLDGLGFVSTPLPLAPRDFDRSSRTCYAFLLTLSPHALRPIRYRQISIRNGPPSSSSWTNQSWSARKPSNSPNRYKSNSSQFSPVTSSLSSSDQILLCSRFFVWRSSASFTCSQLTRVLHLGRVGKSIDANYRPIQLPTCIDGDLSMNE